MCCALSSSQKILLVMLTKPCSSFPMATYRVCVHLQWKSEYCTRMSYINLWGWWRQKLTSLTALSTCSRIWVESWTGLIAKLLLSSLHLGWLWKGCSRYFYLREAFLHCYLSCKVRLGTVCRSAPRRALHGAFPTHPVSMLCDQWCVIRSGP